MYNNFTKRLICVLLGSTALFSGCGEKGKNNDNITDSIVKQETNVKGVILESDESKNLSSEILDGSSDIDRITLPTPPEINTSTISKDDLNQFQAILTDNIFNTFDYFITASGTISYFTKTTEENYSIDFIADLQSKESYEHIITNDSDIENITCNGVQTVYDNIAKTKMIFYINTDEVSDIEKEIKEWNPYYNSDKSKIENRHYIDDEGYEHWFYDQTLIGTGMSNSIIKPQEMTLALLSDFSKWGFDDDSVYIDRECYIISGEACERYLNNYNVKHFKIWVDKNTFVFLKYEGYDENDEIVHYIAAENISFDKPIKSPNQIHTEKEENSADYSTPI